jgi:hypothetical protein
MAKENGHALWITIFVVSEVATTLQPQHSFPNLHFKVGSAFARNTDKSLLASA